MSNSRDGVRLLRVSGVAGIVGPIVFVIVFTALGQITPGYSAVNQVISNLELGQDGWVQQLNFFQMGTLIVVFAFGFRQVMMNRSQRLLKLSSVLLALSGLGMVEAAIFTPAHPTEHTLGFLVFMIPLLAAIILLGLQFRRTRELRNLGIYSLATGSLALLLLLYFFFQGASAPIGQVPTGVIGVVNRIFVVLALSWFCVMGGWLIRREAGNSASASWNSETNSIRSLRFNRRFKKV